MGILKDTYIVNKVNKIDTSKIGYEMKRKNDIQEKQNIVLNNTRDRVDISLNEYESLKKEVKELNESLKYYRDFYNDLGMAMQTDPIILLKSKVLKCEVERTPLTMKNNLYVVFELGDNK